MKITMLTRVLRVRSSIGDWLYALGLMSRVRCFKWAVDASLGEWS